VERFCAPMGRGSSGQAAFDDHRSHTEAVRQWGQVPNADASPCNGQVGDLAVTSSGGCGCAFTCKRRFKA
jgi:hypothetical protein